MNQFFRKGGGTIFLLLLFFAIRPCLCLAQNVLPDDAQPDSSVTWLIITEDENEFFGTLVDRTDTYLQLQTDVLGLISIPINSIRKMQRIQAQQIVEGQLWTENPQSTRYFLGPTGYGLRAGEGYYQNVWVFFNQFAIGVNDYVSIGLGLVPTFLFGGGELPAWVTPRVSLPLGGKDGYVNLGVTAFVGGTLGGDEGGFSALLGSFTLGSRHRNLSLGIGFVYIDSQFEEQPAFSINGMYRLGRRGYLLVESFIADSEGVLLVGVRSVGKNMSFDYGLLAPLGGGGFALPWLSISLPFGN